MKFQDDRTTDNEILYNIRLIEKELDLVPRSDFYLQEREDRIRYYEWLTIGEGAPEGFEWEFIRLSKSVK